MRVSHLIHYIGRLHEFLNHLHISEAFQYLHEVLFLCLRKLSREIRLRDLKMDHEEKRRKESLQSIATRACSLIGSFIYVEDTDVYLLHLKSRSHVQRCTESETLFVF